MICENSQVKPHDKSNQHAHDPLPLALHPDLVQPLWRDPLLVCAFLIAGLLTAFQLGVALLQPLWRSSFTDWFRAALAWPELLVLVLISLWLTRARRPQAPAWWMISAGLLMYAIAQSLWGVFDQVVFPNRAPFPWWPDLFYLLQYPCFFLALTLLPRLPPWEQPRLTRVKVILDCLLLMAAGTALSWYFLLAPLYEKSEESLLGKITSLAYPVGDLGVFFGLVLMLAYRRPVGRSVLALLMGAVLCLALADSLYTYIDFHSSYLSGGLDDLFYVMCYLLFPLAALAHLRFAQRDVATRGEKELQTPISEPPLRGAVLGSLRFLLPFVVALLAGGLIMVQATLAPDDSDSPFIPLAVALGLLLLVIARQEITFLEGNRWRREREVARSNELAALQEANRRMDTFLGMASHELKTPLTSMKLGLQLTARRFQRLTQCNGGTASESEPIVEGFAGVERQAARLERLVNDLLDASRIQANKLELRIGLANLAVIVREVVDEQSQAALYRTIRLHLPPNQQVPILADADRIGQVVANYLTNALKYSPEDRPVEVGVEIEEGAARVWVRDLGPGLPPEEQERIWERFHRATGVEVQSGTGVGLGLGLYICRMLIERHQGQIGVESAPGAGSTFWFTLPLASERPA